MVFLIFKKKGARRIIEMEFQKNEDWFVDIRHLSTKDNSLSSSYMVSYGRLETWIISYLNDGWIIVEDNREKNEYCIKYKKEI